MKILFALASAEYLRYYDSTIALLVSRGHDVVVAVNHDRGGKKFVTLEQLPPSVQVLGVLPAAEERWRRVAKGLRGTQDFIRYLDPRFRHATALRARIRRKVLPPFLHRLDAVPTVGTAPLQVVQRTLALLEDGIPPVADLDRLLRSLAPDAIVVSPLVDAASEQVDLVKSARRLGIPVAAAIASWDNLTNKGLLRVRPDLVIVWNRAQEREAVELHGVPASRVAVTGAQPFDRWFERRPTRDAAAFAQRVGLAPQRPFVVFAGSSGFISEAATEIKFTRAWIAAVRACSDPRVSTLQILVRPHPYNARLWSETVLNEWEGVSIWPRAAYNPVDAANREDFFDTLYHASAVVGVNTSALIEAAIVGRPVFSVRAPEFSGTQDGTLHFHHLLQENGGFLNVASSLAEHVEQLAAVLSQPAVTARQLAAFVDSFVRPHGRDVPATPRVVDAIEGLGQRPPLPDRPWRRWIARPLMSLVAQRAAASAASAAVARARDKRGKAMKAGLSRDLG